MRFDVERQNGASWLYKLEHTYTTLLADRRLSWAVVAVGVVLRLIQYLHDRPLWYDEVLLTLNIVDRPFGQLLLPLDYQQGAPIGFLILQKMVVTVFGSSEYALRIIPLCASIISLLLLQKIARSILQEKAVVLAIAFFALAPMPTYYGSEVKQYGTDVAIAICILYMALSLREGSISLPRLLFYGTVGAIFIWSSHPAIFCLAGSWAVLLVQSLVENNRARAGRLIILGSIWFASLGLLYVVSLRFLMLDDYLRRFWADGFMPRQPMAIIPWLSQSAYHLLDFVAGRRLASLGSLMFLAGCFILWGRNRLALLLLLVPIVCVFLAAGLGIYPFANRMILFLAPTVCLLIGEGAEGLRCLVAESRSRVVSRQIAVGVSLALVGSLFLFPVWSIADLIARPIVGFSNGQEDIRSVAQYLAASARASDSIYVYANAWLPLQYYVRQYNLGRATLIEGSGGPGPDQVAALRDFVSDIDSLRGTNRIWFVFSHVVNSESLDDEQFFLFNLDSAGKRLDIFSADGASAYLYDLSGS